MGPAVARTDVFSATAARMSAFNPLFLFFMVVVARPSLEYR
jgi:hypothetical protein